VSGVGNEKGSWNQFFGWSCSDFTDSLAPCVLTHLHLIVMQGREKSNEMKKKKERKMESDQKSFKTNY